MEFRKGDTEAFIIDESGKSYDLLPDGYVLFESVYRNLVGDAPWGAQYIEGGNGLPKLGEGLRFSGLDEADYKGIGIHPEDIDEFVRRVYAWKAFKSGLVIEGGRAIPLEADNLKVLQEYLESFGVVVQEGHQIKTEAVAPVR